MLKFCIGYYGAVTALTFSVRLDWDGKLKLFY